MVDRLGSYYERLASSNEEGFNEIDVSSLIKCLKSMLTNVNSNYRDEYFEVGKIQFLSLMVINLVLRSTSADICCDSYFVMECMNMATDLASRHRTCAFACVDRLAKLRNGVHYVACKEVLHSINSSVPPFVWNNSNSTKSRDDLIYALMAMLMISKMICSCASKLVKSKGGIDTITTFISHSHTSHRRIVLE